MILTAIVAMTPERIIGRGGDLPWHLPEDLQFFKRTTSSHPIVMGRKTFESIGKPLPKRQNIVLTRDPDWAPDGIGVQRPAGGFPSRVVTEGTGTKPLPELTVIHDPHQVAAIELLDPHAFIIGGAQVYELFLPLLDDLLVSHVHESHPGDTRFPEFEQFFPNVTILEQHELFEIRHYRR